MKDHKNSYRMTVVAIALLFTIGLTGCQTGALGFQGWVVKPDNRILFPPEGTSTGSWQTRDMTIEYQLTRKSDGVHLTGTLYWANHIVYNYNQVRINLRANYFDSQDTVTGGQGIPLLGSFRLQESLQINRILTPSATDKGLAFSYSGRATDGASGRMRGRGDAIDFSIWHTP